VTLTREQARFVGLYVANVEGAASVDIRDRGRGEFQLVVFDKRASASRRRRCADTT
jgi:hypothetical protein